MSAPWDFITPIWHQHLDEYPTFSGGLTCVAYPLFSGVDLAPGAVTGTGISFTTSQPFFKPEVIGRELWKESDNGVGTGRATITEFISTTEVLCDITVDFNSLDVMLAGHWFLTTKTLIGLWHLEGETVRVQVDGAHHPDCVVTNGRIVLNYQGSVVHVGLKYVGIVKSMKIEAAAVNGPAQTKPMNINRLGLGLLNAVGLKYGTSLYTLEDVPFEDPQGTSIYPLPPYTGNKRLPLEDTTDIEKHIYLVQDTPLPCTILNAVPFADTDNE